MTALYAGQIRLAGRHEKRNLEGGELIDHTPEFDKIPLAYIEEKNLHPLEWMKIAVFRESHIGMHLSIRNKLENFLLQ